MSKVNDALHTLFIELADSGVDFCDFTYKDLQHVFDLVKDKEYIVWINDHVNRLPVYINDAGLNYYYGLDSNMLNDKGYEVYRTVLDPGYFDDLTKSKIFWDTNPLNVNNTTYHVRTKMGVWRWTHASSKALNFEIQSRKPKYVLTLVHDIEKLIFGEYQPTSDHFYSQKQQRYNLLTRREKEVLDKIVNEKTSHEIARELFLETSTIESHRKHIKNKLRIKSSLGMVKYYLLFSEAR